MIKYFQSRPLVLIILLCVCQVSTHAKQSADSNPASDIRVLVDISGSMKLNDPENLRIPAIQLLSNLLPTNSDAGVWTFGEYVNMLVPLGPVNNNWKQTALAAAKNINSAGLYTNIGGAMEKASYGWKTSAPDIKRSLILLTDGMVDVSKDDAKNSAARHKVLAEILPHYKEAGITIHTIALSGEADEHLLSTIAAETDGWYQKVLNASDLQKVFLKIFEQATERDSVPITNNHFSIDQQIEEFTVLVFKNKDSKPTILEQPDGDTYQAGDDDIKITWFESADYDLMTINLPMAGEWIIHADVDPDNRVLIVSNLKMKSTALPNNLLANEKFNFTVQLFQDGDVVTDTDFLNLLSITVEVLGADGSEGLLKVMDDGKNIDDKAADGIYSVELSTPSIAGIAQLSARVESPTFQRMRQQAINVFDTPVRVDEDLSDDINSAHKLTFTPVNSVSKADSLQIEVEAILPDGQKLTMTAARDSGFSSSIELPVIPTGGKYQVQLNISGETPAGRPFQVRPAIHQFIAKSLIAEPLIEELPEEVIEVIDDEEVDKVFLLSIGLLVSILLIAIGGAFSRIFKHRNVKLAKTLSEQMELQ